MSARINPLIFVILLFSFSANAQDKNYVNLKWKLNPGEVITYKVDMQEIDTANHKEMEFGGLFKSLMGKDTVDNGIAKAMITKLAKTMGNSNYSASLQEKKRNII